MNKIAFKVFIAFLLFILLIPKCDAILCTKGLFNELSEKAKKVEAVQNGDTITIKNVDKDIMIEYNSKYYEETNGIVEIKTKDKIDELDIYGGYDTECVEEYILSVPVKQSSSFDFMLFILIVILIFVVAFLIKSDFRKKGKNEKK